MQAYLIIDCVLIYRQVTRLVGIHESCSNPYLSGRSCLYSYLRTNEKPQAGQDQPARYRHPPCQTWHPSRADTPPFRAAPPRRSTSSDALLSFRFTVHFPIHSIQQLRLYQSQVFIQLSPATTTLSLCPDTRPVRGYNSLIILTTAQRRIQQSHSVAYGRSTPV